MFVGVYLLLSGLVALLALLALVLRTPTQTSVGQLRSHILRFVLLTPFVSLAALSLFIWLSVATGLLRFGQSQSYRIPNDYVAYGPLGWLILACLGLGILAPVLVALWLSRHSAVRPA